MWLADAQVELAASMARAMRVVVQQQLLDAATLAHQDNRAVAQTYWRESYEQLLESLRIANNTGRLSPEEAQLNVAAARSVRIPFPSVTMMLYDVKSALLHARHRRC